MMSRFVFISIIISFAIIAIMLAFVLWMMFELQPDYADAIYDSLVTNQTLRNSIPCEKIEIVIASGEQMMITNKPQKLIDELKDIAIERQCQFERPDLWLDGYSPDRDVLP